MVQVLDDKLTGPYATLLSDPPFDLDSILIQLFLLNPPFPVGRGQKINMHVVNSFFSGRSTRLEGCRAGSSYQKQTL